MNTYWKYSKGSEWRKWDLHIHTPVSICQNYGGVQSWDKFIEALENLPSEVKAIGINDYYFIDGYQKVMEYKISGRISNIEKIFPILEFRIDTFGSGNENKLQKINLHILFNIDESRLSQEIQLVKNEFINQIPLTKLARHQTKMLSIENLISEGNGNLQTGFSNLIPSTDKVFELINSTTWKDKTFTLLGYKEWSNLEKNNQLRPLKEDLYDRVDAFLSSNHLTIENCQNWLNEFGNKRLLHSGDYHDFTSLDTANKDEASNLIASQKYICNTWVKADPTFNGLKQIKYEPEDRVKIQAIKPDIKNERHIISNIQFFSSANLFGNQLIELNDNLNSIIGGKSSGKSLLIHSIASSIDIEQVKRISKRLGFDGYSFDNEEYDFKVTWKDGESDSLKSEKNLNRKITYIPQLYINYLAEKNNKEELNSLIGNILLQDFSYKTFFDSVSLSITDISRNIEEELLSFISTRSKVIELNSQVKEIGASKAIQDSISQLEKQIIEGQKLSNLSEIEVSSYNSLVAEKERLENNHRLINSKIETFERFKNELLIINNYLFGSYDTSGHLIKKGKLDSISEELSTHSDNDVISTKIKIESNLKSIISEYDISIKSLNINSTLSSIKQEIENIKKKIIPFQEKLAGQKELSKLSEQLEKEKNKKIASINLENQLKRAIENYHIIRNSITDLLNQRFNKYKSIVEKINSTKNRIGEEITLNCNLIYKKELFPLFNQANKAAIAQNHFFNEFFNDDFVVYDLIPNLFNNVIKVSDETLHLRDDKTIPIRHKINIEDILNGLIKDNFELDFKVTYKNDEILHMSPGKKGTVLLILFLQISSAEYPILIDQPEDNLDNRTIYDLLCKIIKEKKKDRQIITVSHNANLVVATDSENIIVANQIGQDSILDKGKYRFDYVNGALEFSFKSDNSVEEVLYQQGIREHVCDVLEGGDEAFKQRELKYSIK